MNLYESTGKLDYSYEDSQHRLVLMINQSISDYYFSLIPKYKNAKPQKWRAHVTIVRPYKEVPVNLEPWGRYQGEEVVFCYDSMIHFDKIYFWLNVFCKRLEEIRAELGLPVVSEYTLPPGGFIKCFHCTIGNCKD